MVENPVFPDEKKLREIFKVAEPKLISFEKPEHVYNLLTFAKSHYHFFFMIKSIKGVQLIQEENESYVLFKGKEVSGTRKVRFTKEKEITALLEIAGLKK